MGIAAKISCKGILYDYSIVSQYFKYVSQFTTIYWAKMFHVKHYLVCGKIWLKCFT